MNELLPFGEYVAPSSTPPPNSGLVIGIESWELQHFLRLAAQNGGRAPVGTVLAARQHARNSNARMCWCLGFIWVLGTLCDCATLSIIFHHHHSQDAVARQALQLLIRYCIVPHDMMSIPSPRLQMSQHHHPPPLQHQACHVHPLLLGVVAL